MIYRNLQAYKSNEVNTASKIKLVIMLYDGAIRFMKECLKKIEEKDIAGRGIYISKAQKIIGELQESINSEKGGEVSITLEKAYSLILAKLTHANIKGDAELVRQSISILSELRFAWNHIANESANAAQGPMANEKSRLGGAINL